MTWVFLAKAQPSSVLLYELEVTQLQAGKRCSLCSPGWETSLGKWGDPLWHVEIFRLGSRGRRWGFRRFRNVDSK